MAIIYSYDNQNGISGKDSLLGTSAKEVNGRQSNQTKNFLLSDIADFINVAGYPGTPGRIQLLGGTGGPLTNSLMYQDLYAQDGNLIVGTKVILDNGLGEGNFEVAQNISAGGNLDIIGNATISGNLTNAGLATLNGGLISSQNTVLGNDANNTLSINSKTYLSGPIYDYANNIGNTEQVLVSDGSGYVTWQNYQGSGLEFQTTWNADTDVPDLTAISLDPNNTGKYWVVSVDGATDLSGITDWKAGDWAIISEDNSGNVFWDKIDNSPVLTGGGEAGFTAFWEGDTVLGKEDLIGLYQGVYYLGNNPAKSFTTPYPISTQDFSFVQAGQLKVNGNTNLPDDTGSAYAVLAKNSSNNLIWTNDVVYVNPGQATAGSLPVIETYDDNQLVLGDSPITYDSSTGDPLLIDVDTSFNGNSIENVYIDLQEIAATGEAGFIMDKDGSEGTVGQVLSAAQSSTGSSAVEWIDVSAGTGTTNTLPLWTDGPNGTLGDSIISETLNSTNWNLTVGVNGGNDLTIDRTLDSNNRQIIRYKNANSGASWAKPYFQLGPSTPYDGAGETSSLSLGFEVAANTYKTLLVASGQYDYGGGFSDKAYSLGLGGLDINGNYNIQCNEGSMYTLMAGFVKIQPSPARPSGQSSGLAIDDDLVVDRDVKFTQYGTGVSGTAAYSLAVDSSGNVITEDVVTDPVTTTGSHQTNYIPKFASGFNSTITDSDIVNGAAGVRINNVTSIQRNPSSLFNLDVNGDKPVAIRGGLIVSNNPQNVQQQGIDTTSVIIGLGNQDIITNSNHSLAVGTNNQITNNSDHSFAVGASNQLSGSLNSIVGGNSNEITNSDNSVSQGLNNEIVGLDNSIVLGNGNTVKSINQPGATSGGSHFVYGINNDIIADNNTSNPTNCFTLGSNIDITTTGGAGHRNMFSIGFDLTPVTETMTLGYDNNTATYPAPGTFNGVKRGPVKFAVNTYVDKIASTKNALLITEGSEAQSMFPIVILPNMQQYNFQSVADDQGIPEGGLYSSGGFVKINQQGLNNTTIHVSKVKFDADGATNTNYEIEAETSDDLIIKNGNNSGDVRLTGSQDLRVEQGEVRIESPGRGLILTSPDGTEYEVTVSNAGALSVSAV